MTISADRRCYTGVLLNLQRYKMVRNIAAGGNLPNLFELDSPHVTCEDDLMRLAAHNYHAIRHERPYDDDSHTFDRSDMESLYSRNTFPVANEKKTILNSNRVFGHRNTNQNRVNCNEIVNTRDENETNNTSQINNIEYNTVISVTSSGREETQSTFNVSISDNNNYPKRVTFSDDVVQDSNESVPAITRLSPLSFDILSEFTPTTAPTTAPTTSTQCIRYHVPPQPSTSGMSAPVVNDEFPENLRELRIDADEDIDKHEEQEQSDTESRGKKRRRNNKMSAQSYRQRRRQHANAQEQLLTRLESENRRLTWEVNSLRHKRRQIRLYLDEHCHIKLDLSSDDDDDDDEDDVDDNAVDQS